MLKHVWPTQVSVGKGSDIATRVETVFAEQERRQTKNQARDFLSQQNTDWMRAGTETKQAEAAPIDLHRLANPYEVKNYHKVPAVQPVQPQPAPESSRPGVQQSQSLASRNQQQALAQVEKERRTADRQGRNAKEPSPQPVEVFLTQQEEQRRKRDQLKQQLDQQAQEDRERKEKLKRDQAVQDAYWEDKAQREQEKIYQRYRQEEEELKLKRSGLPVPSKLQDGNDQRVGQRSNSPPDRPGGGQYQPRNQSGQAGAPAKADLQPRGVLMTSLEKNGMSFDELQQLIRRGTLGSAKTNNQSRDREGNSQDTKRQGEVRSRSPSPVLSRIDNIKQDQDLLKLKSRNFEEELEKFMKFKSDQNKLRGGQGPQKPYYDYINMYKTDLYPIGDPNSTRIYKPPGKDGNSVTLGQNFSQDTGPERLVQPQYGVRVLQDAKIPRLGPDPNRAVGRPSARENTRLGNKTDQQIGMLERMGFDQMTSYRDLNKKLTSQKLESEVRQELVAAMNKGKQLSMAGMNPAAKLTRTAAVTTGVRGVAIPALDFQRDQIARQEAEEKYKDLVLAATFGSQDVAVLEYEVNREKRRQSFHIPEGLALEQAEPGQETDQIQRVLEEIEGLV